MSDYDISLVPIDPWFVPTRENGRRAYERAKSIVKARKCQWRRSYKMRRSPRPVFYPAGANFEGIFCPHCNARQAIEWWQAQMERDFDGEYIRSFSRFSMPCCAKACDLNDLRYDWPEGFGRFAITCVNPGIGRFTKRQLTALGRIVGCELRQILAHW